MHSVPQRELMPTEVNAPGPGSEEGPCTVCRRQRSLCHRGSLPQAQKGEWALHSVPPLKKELMPKGVVAPGAAKACIACLAGMRDTRP